MSSNTERNGVTFIWTIENFDGCSNWDFNIKSPVFLSNSLNDSEWQLSIGQFRSNNGDRYISFSVTRCGSKGKKKSGKLKNVTVDCEFSIVDEYGAVLEWMEIKKRRFGNGYSWSCEKFASYRDVFESRKDKFLHSNILTIRCRMWSCSGDTQVELRFLGTKIDKINFVWTIKNFLFLKPHQSNKIYVKNTSSETPILTFTFFSKEDHTGEIEVTWTVGRTEAQSSCNIEVLDNTGKKCMSSGWYSFSSELVSRNPSTSRVQRLEPLPTSYLMKNTDLYLPMGALTMRVKCFVWNGESRNENVDQVPIQNFQVTENFLDIRKCDKKSMTETSTSNFANNSKVEEKVLHDKKHNTISHRRLVQSMKCMYEEGLLSDFTFLAGGKTFLVHKNILCARSPVFRTMFTTAMKEKESHFTEIQDVDADTFQRMLLFIYSDYMEDDLQWESPMNLYFVADKYGINDLKQASRSILKSELCSSNVCDILVHAELHEDHDLKSTAVDFIADHDKEIIGSEIWKRFQKNHIQLTVEILSELYLKKRGN